MLLGEVITVAIAQKSNTALEVTNTGALILRKINKTNIV